MRTHSHRSSGAPVASTILSSSSRVSSENTRTPWSKYASRTASADFTGCMKHRVAFGSTERTSRTSVIEATS